MSIKAAFILPGCSHSQGGHPPPPVMPDPDRASRAIIPYFGGALRAGKAELVFLDARIRKHDGGGVSSPAQG